MHDLAQYNVGKVKDTETGPQARTKPGTKAKDTTVAPHLQDDIELDKQRVRMEAERVQAKFVSSVDTSSEVILRLDFMNNHDTRVAMLVVYAATFAGFVIFLVQFISTFTMDGSTRHFRRSAQFVWNIAVGAFCLVLIIGIFAAYAWRVFRVSRQNKVWEPRRKRLTTLFLFETALQGVNLGFYISPNVYLLCNPFDFYSTFVNWCGWVRWTCWNTFFLLFMIHAYSGVVVGKGLERKLIGEGPWHWLWPCLVPWLLLQTATSMGWLHNVTGSARRQADGVALESQRGNVFNNCGPDLFTRISVGTMVGIALLYFVATCALIVWKLNRHKKMPYRQIQLGTVFFRLQLRLRVGVMLFFALCLVLLWLVHPVSCATIGFVSFGIMPMQVVMTASAFVWSFICMPHTPQDEAAAKRIWEQEFAWTEADKPIKLAARALTVPASSSLNLQPMFCFMTMMQMWYWSGLAYDHQRAAGKYKRTCCQGPSSQQADASRTPKHTQRTNLDLETAMSMYGLTDSELFSELKRDTRCLIGWNKNTIVLAFRGTASMTNALSDLQAWRVAHPPVRGLNCIFSRPLVHVGFLRSWLAGDFNKKVLSRVMEIAKSCNPGQGKLQVYITGHSLGGALATLAAYDIKKALQACGKGDGKVMCYSFGAPRTGNHAFARDYNSVVPDTWSIINDQDVVTRGGKFLFLYKRPGHRVVVNAGGRMMVSPSALEASVQQSFAGQSVDQHLLSSYNYAILSIILAQFTCKGFSDGMEGIVGVVEAAPKLQEQLEKHMGMRLEDMQRLSQLSPEAREGQSLVGAHMPTRGFYQIKSKQAVRQISCCGFLLGWRLQRDSHDNTATGSPQADGVSGLDALDAKGSHVVIDMGSEQLPGEQVADPRASEPIGG